MPNQATATVFTHTTHTTDCNDLAIGRGFRHMPDTQLGRQTGEVSGAEFVAELRRIAEQDRRPCDCRNLALGRVENSLRLARKAVRSWQEKCPGDEMHLRSLTHRVEQLTARRDALKAAL